MEDHLDQLLSSEDAHGAGVDAERFEDSIGQLFLMSSQIQFRFDFIQLLLDEFRIATTARFLLGDQVQLGQAQQRFFVPVLIKKKKKKKKKSSIKTEIHLHPLVPSAGWLPSVNLPLAGDVFSLIS